MSLLEKKLLLLNIFVYFVITVFSYSYVDLNLTISQKPLILNFVESMQSLGYYNRQISTLIYFIILLASFIFFGLTLYLVRQNLLSIKYVFFSTFINTFLLVFAYPFLSSDIFNYMFDAKIIVKYHSNPYAMKPLDFTGDEWLRFMRWTHRYSPYGPLWLGFTTIPYIIGFSKFVITLLSFKVFISFFHLINTYFIYRILETFKGKKAIFGAALYGLNPLLLLEGAANAHNDVVLAASILGSIYFAVKNKKTFSVTSLFSGVLTKYTPILLLPWLVISVFFNKLRIDLLVWLYISTMITFTIIYSTVHLTVPFVNSGSIQVQFQPWYLFWILPLLALVPSGPVVIISVVISFFAAMRYLPFLLNGNWSQPGTIEYMRNVTILPLIATFIVIAVFRKIKVNFFKFHKAK